MGEDYPRNQVEFDRRFSTEVSCREYLAGVRWPEGFVCPRCHMRAGWATGRSLIVCSACGYQASPTAGTIFQDTRKPLGLWFRAIWVITTQKNGASAMTLQRILGLGSYSTAWTWLHKLRRAMVRPGRDQLAGRIEVDDAFVGGVEEGVYGRQPGDKAMIVVAAQEDGKRMGRIRLRRIPDGSAAHLHRFIQDYLEPGSTVRTDGWMGYRGLPAKGYVHDIIKMKHRRQSNELLPRVHLVVSLLKRWLLGTHQGAVGHEYLDYYLDEFTFRFNRRSSQSRGKLFYRLIQQAVTTEPAPYDTLVQH